VALRRRKIFISDYAGYGTRTLKRLLRHSIADKNRRLSRASRLGLRPSMARR